MQVNSQSNVSAGLADQALTATGATGTRTSTFGVSANLTTVIVAIPQPPSVLFYQTDQLGSTRLLTDSAGVVRGTFSYDAYGNSVGSTGSYSTPLSYAGQYRDTESGLIYLLARYYDPTTAQFLSRDAAVASTRSPYGYVGDNPLNATDPSGLIDPSLLSQSQINQINQACSSWQNQSFCTQAAFCSEWTAGIGSNSGGDCRTIAQIAANDYAVVQAALTKAGPCNDVGLMGGYIATHAEAERDLAETKLAFQAAVASLNWYNQDNTCKAGLAATAVALIGGGAVAGDAAATSGIGGAARGTWASWRNLDPGAKSAITSGVIGAAASIYASCGG